MVERAEDLANDVLSAMAPVGVSSVNSIYTATQNRIFESAVLH